MFKWKFPNPFGRRNRKNITKKIVLGICAMDKKTKAKPMREILDRLPADLFEIKIFGDDCILNQPIEAWPVVEVLITFYSTKFPTEKALEYIKLRKPFLINDLSMESTLQDRRKVYNLLEQCGIDVPRHIYVSRDEEGTNYDIEEFDEYIVINGEQLNKPFVEKPVYAEDHNIYIYYPISAGGGSKRLFRKVDDKSAEFYPHINEIRREGSYIYEEFVTTQGTDVKVYTVGPEYGHAEARKSPVVDGRVKRDAEGREQRYPVILSPIEKEMACKIVQAFRQTVCGFDILRVQGKSYCCDVNGFSFVKNSRKYYEDAAQILTEIMLNNLRQEYQLPPSIQTKRVPSPAFNPSAPNSTRAIRNRETSTSFVADGSTYLPTVAMDDASSSVHGNRPPSPSPSIVSDFEYGNPAMYAANQRRYETEELRSVIAIIRHGDRTPKQKMKVVISEQRYLDYYHSYVKTPKKDLKVKSKSGLVKFLEVTREIILDPKTPVELRRKLVQLRDVLERWEISGINRKLQMKPQKWDEDEIVEVEELVEMDDDSTGSGSIAVGGDSSCEDIAVQSPDVSCAQGETTSCEVGKESFDNGEGQVSQEMSLRPHSSTEDNGYSLGLTPTTPSSVSKPLRRRQLVKTKKVIREGTGLATELLVILKWGGDLTPLGREQAEKLGERFRNENYPGDDNGGVLRLHATYRHDLKIKASDEGRVMKTAAAFTKGLLELEGQLTPILASLVTIEEKNRTMLDRGGNFEMKEEMDRCKKHLNLLQVDQEVTDELIEQIVPGCSEVTRKAFHDLGNPLEKLRRMHYLIDRLCTQLEFLCIRREESGVSVDDSQVMTEYILPASSNTDVTAPSPISLNMVGINMPEVYSAAATPTVPYLKANKSESTAQATVETVATLQLPVSNANAPLGIADESAQPPQMLPTQDSITDITTNGNAQVVPGSAGGPSDVSTNPPTMSSTTNTNNNAALAPAEAEDLSYLNTLYLNETFDLMLERWKKLYKEFYSSKTNQYDLTKLPDVYDMIRYDILHNQHLNFTGIDELYEIAKKFEIVVVPQEYGIDAADKRYIGSKMCGALLEKIKHDLTIASGVDSGLNNQDPMLFQLDHSHAEDMRINSIGRVVRTRLYFTSESHLHTILNVFRYPKPNSPFSLGKEAMERLEEITNVSYLSQIVIRLFEDRIERGKFSCELSFSSGSTQHDPAVMATTTYQLDSPYLLAPYVYLDRSLNLYQLLGCLDDAIELYHSTDKHTINAMLLAATASSGQISAQPLTPTMSQDAQDTTDDGGIVVSKGKSKKLPGSDGSLDAVMEGQGQEEEEDVIERVNPLEDGCVTPPPVSNVVNRTSSVKGSASSKLKSGGVSVGNTPMSVASTHQVREEVVDADPEPMIDSLHATPVKVKTGRASTSSFGASEGRKPPLSADKPTRGSAHSQKMSTNSKIFDDLTSPLPMRRNFSVTVNIDEASDNWERLEKKLFTTHPFHNKHLSAMQGGVMSGATTGSSAGISRTRQQELDLLTRRAVASQLQQQQQQQQLAAGCVSSVSQSNTFTSAAVAGSASASVSAATAATPLRVPAKRAVSHDTAVMAANMSMESIAISSAATAAAEEDNDTCVPSDASVETRVATQSPKPKSPKFNKDLAEPASVSFVATPVSLHHAEENVIPSAPLTVSSSPSLNTSLTHSRKRTGSLSADNIVLLDRSGVQERERASSELGLVSESRVLAATPTTTSLTAAGVAGSNNNSSGVVMMVIESNATGGHLTVLKPSSANSSSSLVVATPAETPSAIGEASVSQTTGVSAVSSPVKTPATADITAMGESSQDTPETQQTVTTPAAAAAAAVATPDVIVVQRSLSDIENRRLKDSLFLASDFYVPSSSSASTAVTGEDTANNNNSNGAK